MKIPRITYAMQNIDEDLIAEAADYRPQPKKIRIWKRVVSIAACLLLIVVPLITVEAAYEGISRLFSLVWGDSHNEIVDNLGEPVGVSASADGFTLSVEAVLGDRHHAMIVYKFTREDSQPLPGESLHFQTMQLDLVYGQYSSGCGFNSYPVKGKPNEAYIITNWDYNAAIAGRTVKTTFSHVFTPFGKGSRVLAEGPWELEFKLDYEDTTIDVPVNGMMLPEASDSRFEFQQLEVSAVGVFSRIRWLNANDTEYDNFDAQIKKYDGTILPLMGTHFSSSYTESSMTMDISFGGTYAYPIPVEEIDAVIVNGVEIPVN